MCTKQLLDIQIIQTGMKLNNLDGGGDLKYYFTINQNLIQSLEECKERSFLIEIFNMIKIKTGIYRKQQEYILQIFWFSLAHFRNILKNDSFEVSFSDIIYFRDRRTVWFGLFSIIKKPFSKCQRSEDMYRQQFSDSFLKLTDFTVQFNTLYALCRRSEPIKRICITSPSSK